MEFKDKGPWTVASETGHKIESDDFTHDVTLTICGDFGSDADRIEYAKGLCELLNRRWITTIEAMQDLPAYCKRKGEAMSKAKHCDECRHATVKQYIYKGPPAFVVLTCAKKHKPRFCMPRNDNPLDLNWGWKRACADFETANVI